MSCRVISRASTTRSVSYTHLDVDEFCLQILRTYPRKDAEGKDGTVEFKNVNSGDLGLETEDEKKAAEEATTANKALFDAMKDALDGKVKEVKVSTRLKDHPVCLSADGPLSIEMEKVLSKQPGSEGVKSDKVLELNVNHPVFAVLKAAPVSYTHRLSFCSISRLMFRLRSWLSTRPLTKLN